MSFLGVLLVIHGLLYVPGSTSSQSGSYNVKLEKFEKCPESGTDESIFDTRLSKVSRNKTVLTGTFRLYPDFDENSKAHIEMQEWGNQGYRPKAIRFSFSSCSKLLNGTGDNLKTYFASTGYNLTGCPIPAGNYTTQDLVMDFKLPSLPVLIYNKYRMVISLYSGKRKVGCTRFYIEAVPKESD